MRRNPGFTAVVVLTLALGIGATTAVFSVVEGFLLRPLPFRDPGRLVVIWENDRATGTTRENASPLDYYDFVDRAHGFDGFGMYALTTRVLTRPGSDPVRLNTARVTRGLPELLGMDMQLGRGFTRRRTGRTDPVRSCSRTRAWRAHFQADPDVVGRAVTWTASRFLWSGCSRPPSTTRPGRRTCGCRCRWHAALRRARTTG